MEWSFLFFFNSVFLGVGLAMDAFSVSVANGVNENRMRKKRMGMIAGIYALFQFLMPMLGWVCVHTIVQTFQVFEKFIPWIALILLLYIGGSMLWESIRGEEEESEKVILGFGTLLVQGIATSIDALSVGFTIADYGFVMALVCSILIAIVTFFICICGLEIGKKCGARFADKGGILGGVILILIGIEIFVKGVLL
ncbi:MAG: manganese efflux pump MntP family protein [Lachnospiraceae bacterium]|nr:manganese efflux pump MntP family protein [Lachnospiraceae bacterium]